jgi:hypothetical protein
VTTVAIPRETHSLCIHITSHHITSRIIIRIRRHSTNRPERRARRLLILNLCGAGDRKRVMQSAFAAVRARRHGCAGVAINDNQRHRTVVGIEPSIPSSSSSTTVA